MKNLEKLTFYMGKMKVWTGGIEGIDGGTMNLRQRENDGMPGMNLIHGEMEYLTREN